MKSMSKELNDDLLLSLSAKTLKVVHTLWPDLEVQVDLALPPQQSRFRDYSTGIALNIAKQIKQNPLETAEKIKDALGDISDIAQITVTAPGFVKFYVGLPGSGEKNIDSESPSKTKLVQIFRLSILQSTQIKLPTSGIYAMPAR